jgi:hypothetical protein
VLAAHLQQAWRVAHAHQRAVTRQGHAHDAHDAVRARQLRLVPVQHRLQHAPDPDHRTGQHRYGGHAAADLRAAGAAGPSGCVWWGQQHRRAASQQPATDPGQRQGEGWVVAS